MKACTLFMAITIFIGCLSSPPSSNRNKSIAFDKKLAEELKIMFTADQDVQKRYTDVLSGEITFQELDSIQEVVFRNHAIRLKEIFHQTGYPGFNLVGKDGEYHFWLMVQHCDFDIEFQKKVLVKMINKVEEGQADPANYGYLIDRVAINSGAPQIYGSQVDYDTYNGRAFPKPISDSINVNVRRKSIGLPPLHDYLNARIDDYWEMNKVMIKSNNITQKPYYKTTN